MRRLLSTTCLLAVITLAGCASAPEQASLTATSFAGADERTLLQTAAQALTSGDSQTAILAFSDAAARNPTDAGRQTLLAMAYQASAAGHPEQLELAAAGYDLAQRHGQDAFWAAALSGRLAFDQGRFADAEAAFARAVLSRPEDGRALLALSMSAYRAGDIALATAAAEQALRTPEAATLWPQATRLAALSRAAGGDAAGARGHIQTLQLHLPGGDEATSGRVDELIRTSAADEVVWTAGVTGEATAPEQVSVDVAIVLSQTTQVDNVGMNLLDGLKMQYGYDSQTSMTRQQGVTVSPRTQTITQAISLPQLTYNLNLFNRYGQYYSVVARPMLTAYNGETSTFFVGRSAKVAVGGVNTASLENIDVGTNVSVTPVAITAEKVKLRIEVSRSYLSTDGAGSFNEALNTFRQTVSATVEVGFGQSLILSGLSEAVRDSSGTKTPVIGDTPLIGSLFNQRTTTNRRDAVLILVTPSPAVSLDAAPWAQPQAVADLSRMWGTLVAPGSDLATITSHLSHSRLFRRSRASDTPLDWPRLPHDQGEILKDLLLP